MSGPPFEDLAHAAGCLEHWREVYNAERPHEALDLLTPIDRYVPSPRPYRPAPEPFDYGPDDQLRRVPTHGRISFKNRPYRVPKAFSGKLVALRPTSKDGVYDIFFRTKLITSIDLNRPMEHLQPVTDVPEHPSRMSPV
jgi:hypothetical protein